MHIDSEALFKLIIDPDNVLNTNNGSIDGSLGLAKMRRPGHLVQIDSAEKVFAFADRNVGSIRVIDLEKENDIYIMCPKKSQDQIIYLSRTLRIAKSLAALYPYCFSEHVQTGYCWS